MNHNSNKHSGWMMWLMMVPCMLALIYAVYSNGFNLQKSWVPIIGMVAMIGLHVWMHSSMHKEYKHEEDKKKR